jgi:hypothetical protein
VKEIQNPYIDIHVDHEYYDKAYQKDILGRLLSLILNEIGYMSNDALKTNLLTAVELVKETLDWKRVASLSKKTNFIENYLRSKEINRATLQALITNIILSSDGLGTLSGFGYEGSRANPEITPMRYIIKG